jgi:hypothetical protein
MWFLLQEHGYGHNSGTGAEIDTLGTEKAKMAYQPKWPFAVKWRDNTACPNIQNLDNGH